MLRARLIRYRFQLISQSREREMYVGEQAMPG